MSAIPLRPFLVILFQKELNPPVQKLHALQLTYYPQAYEDRVCCQHQLLSIHVLQGSKSVVDLTPIAGSLLRRDSVQHSAT